MLFDGAARALRARRLERDELSPRGALTRIALMAGALERRVRDRRRATPASGASSGGRSAPSRRSSSTSSRSPSRPRSQASPPTRPRAAPAGFEIAAGKLLANRAALIAGRAAHQVLGARGTTREHPLGPHTRRLWAWRSEYGDEHHWSTRLGAAVARAGADERLPGDHRRLHRGERLMPDVAHTTHGQPTRQAPMLLTHGFGASQAMWAPNVDALGDDRQVLTWDLPGHGASALSDELSHERCLARDARARSTGSAPRAAVIGGMSLGGYLSLLFCARHPRAGGCAGARRHRPGLPRRRARARMERLGRGARRRPRCARPRALRPGAEPRRGGACGRRARPRGGRARAILTQRDGEVLASLAAVAVADADRRRRRATIVSSAAAEAMARPHPRRAQGHRSTTPATPPTSSSRRRSTVPSREFLEEL